MNELTHTIWASLVALPWLVVLGATLAHSRQLARATSSLLVAGTLLQILSHAAGIVRFHHLRRGGAVPKTVHALIKAESVIWIVGGLLFAAGFWMLIKARTRSTTST